jgi:hypothetical protein
MQAMLVMGLLTARLKPTVGSRLVLVAAVAWSIMAGWLFWLAVHGHPLF